MFKSVNKRESGTIFIEATMVITVVLIVLCAMIGFGFFLYQKSMLNTVATETANYAANNYKYTGLKKIDVENVPCENFVGLTKFRSYKSLLNKSKITKYAQKRAKKTSFSPESVSVTKAELIRDGVGRQRIKLKLKMKVSIVFENVMVAVGLIDSNPTISQTAYAECLDFTEYSGQVFFSKYLQDYFAGTNIGSSLDSGAKSQSEILEMVNKIVK